MTVKDCMTQSERIEAARELLKPTPVEIGKLTRAVRKRFGYLVPGYDWLDHWGVTNYYGERCFVSEPYNLRSNSLAEAEQFAQEIDCELVVLSNSWWFPGATIRLLFRAKKEAGSTAGNVEP